jgi:pimeloyl-ACP methyl ester carboxylesterase
MQGSTSINERCNWRIIHAKRHRRMRNLRTYGDRPRQIALLHGGPGAPGEMAQVGRELSTKFSLLEPLQKAKTIASQITELNSAIEMHGDLPMTLIGFSWGAWLAALYATSHPQNVAKVIIVGSGSFEEKYIADMHTRRLERLSVEERQELSDLMQAIASQNQGGKQAFARAGQLFSKADAYDPLPVESEVLDYQVDVYQSIWPEAAELRRSGKLLATTARIQCPVVAIHGSHDPHPAEGVRVPLENVLSDFRFILLERCGHKPWIERHARERFYATLHEELRTIPSS